LIRSEKREDLWHYVWGINKNLKSHLYRINGIEDHIHVLTHIHPTVALSEYIKTIKNSSTSWIQREDILPHWRGWQDGYAAFTHSIKEKDRLTDYVKGQQEHHQNESYVDELKRLLAEAGIAFDEKYLL